MFENAKIITYGKGEERASMVLNELVTLLPGNG